MTIAASLAFAKPACKQTTFTDDFEAFGTRTVICSTVTDLEQSGKKGGTMSPDCSFALWQHAQALSSMVATTISDLMESTSEASAEGVS